MNLTEKEITVTTLRREGKTFREIGEQMGLSIERVRQIGLSVYKKRAQANDILRNWRMLEKECKRLNIGDGDLVRMVRLLKRLGFTTIRDERLLDEDFVGNIRGVGVRYREAIVSAAEKCLLKNRR